MGKKDNRSGFKLQQRVRVKNRAHQDHGAAGVVESAAGTSVYVVLDGAEKAKGFAAADLAAE